VINNLPIVGIRREFVPGVKETLTSDDFVYPINDQINIIIDIEKYLQFASDGTYSKYKNISGKRYAAVNFSIFLSSATVPDEPVWLALLESCGWTSLYDVALKDWIAVLEKNDNVVIESESAENVDTLKILTRIGLVTNTITKTSTLEIIYPDDNGASQLVYVLTGCMGTVKISSDAGTPIKLEFTMVGALDDITTITDLKSSNITDSITPALLNATIKIDDESVSVSSFEIVIANVQNMFSSVSSKSGYDACRVSDCFITGVLDINEQASTIVEYTLKKINNLASSMTLTLGSLFIICKSLQFTAIDTYKLSFDINGSVEIGIS
jgi:hypothetical protein